MLVDYVKKLLLVSLAGLFFKWIKQQNPMVIKIKVFKVRKLQKSVKEASEQKEIRRILENSKMMRLVLF